MYTAGSLHDQCTVITRYTYVCTQWLFNMIVEAHVKINGCSIYRPRVASIHVTLMCTYIHTYILEYLKMDVASPVQLLVLFP